MVTSDLLLATELRAAVTSACYSIQFGHAFSRKFTSGEFSEKAFLLLVHALCDARIASLVPDQKADELSCDLHLDRVSDWLAQNLESRWPDAREVIRDSYWTLGKLSYGAHELRVGMVKSISDWANDKISALWPHFENHAMALVTPEPVPLRTAWLPPHVTLVGLDELLRVHDGKLICDWTSIVESVKFLKTQESSSKVKPLDLRLPEGVSFEAVSIAFVSSDWAKVSISKQQLGPFSFTQLGMVDGRKKDRPNLLWEALRTFAEHGGSISWDKGGISGNRARSLTKTVERLRKHLRGVFHTSEDPFMPYSKRDGYTCRFKIADESFGGAGRVKGERKRKNDISPGYPSVS